MAQSLSFSLVSPLFCFLSFFQPRTTGCGRMAFPTSVALCCSKPSTTCWSAASWIAASFALESGSWSPTRRMRSPLTRGRPFCHVPILSAWPSFHLLYGNCFFLTLFPTVALLDMFCSSLLAVMWSGAAQWAERCCSRHWVRVFVCYSVSRLKQHLQSWGFSSHWVTHTFIYFTALD